MKKNLIFCLLVLTIASTVGAQCTTGYTNCSLNWDYLSFFPSAGSGTYTNLANSQTQRFAFGTQRLTITHNFTGTNAQGTSTANTAETGSNGFGADVYFWGNGNITVTFLNGVQNVRFSIFDIDASQRITVSSTGNIVTMTEIGSNSHLTTSGSGTSSANTRASTTAIASNNTLGTINVAITSPTPTLTSVTSFTIASSNSGTSDAEFFLSDLSACSQGTFTSNYFHAAKPFTNQPGYIVASRNDSFFFVNPATAAAKFIFSDPAGSYANSVAYDPVRHEIYYAFSLTLPGPAIDPNNKTLRRYNYDADTFGVVIPDITVFAPIFEQGIESGAAAFYDGALYLGLEASNTGTNKSTVWKIEFNSSGSPTLASQVYAIAGAGHDWGDIAVVNGSLVDFDSRPTSPNYYHQNLYDKSVVVYTPAAVDAPRQAAVDWNNVIYNIGGSANSYVVGGVTIATGTIAAYNGNGTINVASIDTIKTHGVAEVGSWGDAGEAFRPRVDYGDAPASYDPVGSDPAVHEISSRLFLGVNKNDEWATRGQTVLANSDDYDDGMVMGTLVNPSGGTFTANVRYFNNTGATATICAWAGFNNNGVFDAGEGRSVTNLPSSASTQTVWINWTGISTTLVDGSITYLRLRISNTSNGMTTSNPTGYFGDGEVEDFRLMVTKFPLATQLVNFTAARRADNKVQVDWKLSNEEAGLKYSVQRSLDGISWTEVKALSAAADRHSAVYTHIDEPTQKSTIYYRLRLTKNTAEAYSAIRKIDAEAVKAIFLSPNPAVTNVNILLQAERGGAVQLTLADAAGRNQLTRRFAVVSGINNLALDLSTLPSGVYWVTTLVEGRQSTQKLLLNH